MSKVKIVQIAVALSESDSDVQYLDDKGRVWYDGGHSERYEKDGKTFSRWVTEWKQIEMPEEPSND